MTVFPEAFALKHEDDGILHQNQSYKLKLVGRLKGKKKTECWFGLVTTSF